MKARVLSAPVRLLKARCDSPSFLERTLGGSSNSDNTVSLTPDHYQLLKQDGVKELAHAIRRYAPSCQCIGLQPLELLEV